jgi:hypothetical protein
LFGFVFEHAKIVFLEAINEFAAIIEDGGVKDDEADVDFDGAALLVDVLIGRRRPGVGERERIILGENRRSGEYEERAGNKESQQNCQRTKRDPSTA